MIRAFRKAMVAGALISWMFTGSHAAEKPAAATTLDEQVDRANELLRRERPTEALNLLQTVVAKDPLNVKANFALGTALIKLAHYREAIDIFERMIKEYPDDYALKNNLAWLYATASEPTVRNLPRAISLAQDAILLQPQDYHVWSTLAEAHYVAGNYDKALRSAEEALRLSKLDPTAVSNSLNYEDQVTKYRRAASAMSLIE